MVPGLPDYRRDNAIKRAMSEDTVIGNVFEILNQSG